MFSKILMLHQQTTSNLIALFSSNIKQWAKFQLLQPSNYLDIVNEWFKYCSRSAWTAFIAFTCLKRFWAPFNLKMFNGWVRTFQAVVLKSWFMSLKFVLKLSYAIILCQDDVRLALIWSNFRTHRFVQLSLVSSKVQFLYHSLTRSHSICWNIRPNAKVQKPKLGPGHQDTKAWNKQQKQLYCFPMMCYGSIEMAKVVSDRTGSDPSRQYLGANASSCQATDSKSWSSQVTNLWSY